MILNCIILMLFSKLCVVCSANVRGLHRSSFFRAQQAGQHEASFETKQSAVIADPVFLRKLLYAIATLVDGDVAVSTKNNHVFIFIVATITYDTLSIFLSSNSP